MAHEKMIERCAKAARKLHPECVVEVSEWGIVEVLLPEDCGLLFHATEGTMLVAGAEMFGGLGGALRATLDDLKMGTYAGVQ